MLIDRFNRDINYLRVSVTDRCNFRCVYCMPEQGVAQKSHADMLTYEEIGAFVKTAVSMGIKRLRLTGGEPLVRRDLPVLIRYLAAIPGLEEISLTTNGFLLERMAAELAEAGLNRVNVSLDTLDAEKFHAITRGGSLDQVWRGITAAEAAGLTPVKINTVAIRGINDGELIDLARLTITHPWHVRFIELMPVGNQVDWGSGFPQVAERYLSVQEMHSILETLHLQPVEMVNGNGPARMFTIPKGLGTVGFISPIGEHFCEGCNRLRLTADGKLRPCLLVDAEVSIREALRNGEDTAGYIRKAIDMKPEGHELEEEIYPQIRKMIDIGG